MAGHSARTYAPGVFVPGWSRRPSDLLKVVAQIQRIARGLGFESSLRLSRIRGRWDEIFSGPLTLHAWPSRLDRHTLTIVVDSPAWLQQLSFLKDDIVPKLTEFGVRDIRFRSGDVPNKKPLKALPSPRELNNNDNSFIETEASHVKDDVLRGHIQRAIRAWAMRSPKSKR